MSRKTLPGAVCIRVMGPLPVTTSPALSSASGQSRPSKRRKPSAPASRKTTSMATAIARLLPMRATKSGTGRSDWWRRSNMGVAPVLDAEDVDDLAEGDELREHPGQLEQLLLREVRAELVPARGVHLVVVEVELVGVAQGGLLAVGEGPALVVGEGRHQLLRDPLAPSQGVARGHSVLALVALGEAKACELLGPVLHETAAHEGRVEGHEAREGLGQPREGEDEVGIAALRLPALQHGAELGGERGRIEQWQSRHLARAPLRSRHPPTRSP